MRLRAAIFVILTFTCIGCEVGPRDLICAEYRPTVGQTSETEAPESDVYFLWQWVPHDPPPSSQEVYRQIPCQVGQIEVAQGDALGFRRDESGRLIAVAGATTRPIVEAHYTWMKINRTRDDALADAIENIFNSISFEIDPDFDLDDLGHDKHHDRQNHDRPKHEEHREHREHDRKTPHKTPTSRP